MASMLSLRARLAGAVLGLPVLASTPLAAAARPGLPSVAEVSAPPLQRTISVHLQNVRLREAVAFIERVSGARVRPFWAAPGIGGLDPDSLMSLDLKSVTALPAIESLLAQASADVESDAPTWQIAADGAIEIGPRSRLNRTKVTVVYSIHDLTAVVPSFKDAPAIELSAALSHDGGSPLRETATDKPGFERPDPSPAEQLMDLISETIEPEQWSQHGGAGASMRLYQGHLIITAPGYIHRQIR